MNEYVLITGASSGIGKELVKLYSKAGTDTILVARNTKALSDLANEMKPYNTDIVIKPFDLSVIDNCYKLFDEIKTLNVTTFINNAGYGNLGLFDKVDLDLELNMLDLNIRSLHIMTKLYIEHFNKGTVVNVSSMAAFLPTPKLAVYAASKSYVYNMSMAINHELKKQNKDLRVLTVTPGPVVTNFSERAKAEINRGMKADKCARLIYKGIQKRKALIIPGILMKITRFLIRFIPTKLLLKFSYSIQTSKK